MRIILDSFSNDIILRIVKKSLLINGKHYS